MSDPVHVVVETTSPTYSGGELYLQPDGSGPAPTGWQGTVANGDTAASHSFKVAAVCANAPSAIGMVSSTTVGYFSINMVQTNCPLGTVALGGGVEVPPGPTNPASRFNATVSALSPTFDAVPTDLQGVPDGAAPPPVGWRSSVRSGADPDNVTMKGGVTCAPSAGVSTQVASVIVPQSTGGGTESSCPVGRIALGGGVELDTIHNASVTSSSPVFAGTLHRLIDQPDGLRPAPVGWYGNVLNYSVAPDVGTFKIGAVCRTPALALFLPVIWR